VRQHQGVPGILYRAAHAAGLGVAEQGRCPGQQHRLAPVLGPNHRGAAAVHQQAEIVGAVGRNRGGGTLDPIDRPFEAPEGDRPERREVEPRRERSIGRARQHERAEARGVEIVPERKACLLVEPGREFVGREDDPLNRLAVSRRGLGHCSTWSLTWLCAGKHTRFPAQSKAVTCRIRTGCAAT